MNDTNKLMPALFVGHGSPVNAILDNEYSQSLRDLGQRIPRPTAVCIVSAHWLTHGTRVSCQTKPEQIYDFYGFPEQLYEINYEPAGYPSGAARAVELLTADPNSAICDTSWGHDHAGWTVLRHLFPEADIPIFVVSLDLGLSAAKHVSLARRLEPLRKEGVLILGSGNIVHNLAHANLSDMDAPAHPAGLRFDTMVKKAILENDLDALVNYGRLGQDAVFSVPTPDHFLPLVWVLAVRSNGERISFPCECFQNHSVSMRSVLLEGL